MQGKQYALGIDFGTTTLSGALVDVETWQIKTAHVETHAYLAFSDSSRREQSITRLDGCFDRLLDTLLPGNGSAIISVGLTGQMHGVIGLDAQHRPATNLVTWQDRSGDGRLSNGKTLLEEMRDRSPGLRISNGYGLATLFKWKVVQQHQEVQSFCTVPDYFGMGISGDCAPCIDPSMAHSVGGYDVLAGDWDREVLRRLGLDGVAFPEVTASPCLRGKVQCDRILERSTQKNIPVAVAIGDNQASFLGTVDDPQHSLLVNMGTGSQISHTIGRSELSAFSHRMDGLDTELRPLMQDMFLVATCITSGGTVYRCLHDFFLECGESLFGLNRSAINDGLWEHMEACGDRAANDGGLNVTPRFDGSRSDPTARGTIGGISLANLTPGNLIRATLCGIAQYHKSFVPAEILSRVRCIYGSGNGLKKNRLLRQAFEEAFGRTLALSGHDEEAAVGAAMAGEWTRLGRRPCPRWER